MANNNVGSTTTVTRKPSLEEVCIELAGYIGQICNTTFQSFAATHREDLMQEGNLAICENYPNFNANIAKASTFFHPHILHRMQEYINKSVYNTTNHYTKNLKAIARAKERLNDCGITAPSDERIYIETNRKVSLVTIKMCQEIEIYNKSVSINDTETFTDAFYQNSSLITESPESICIKKEEAQCLKNGRARLTQMEQTCIDLKNGANGKKPKSYREIGTILGLTPDKVRRIISTAMSKLREDPDIKHIYPSEIRNQQKTQQRGEIGFGSAKTAMPVMNALDDCMNELHQNGVSDINQKKRKKKNGRNKENDFFL